MLRGGSLQREWMAASVDEAVVPPMCPYNEEVVSLEGTPAMLAETHPAETSPYARLHRSSVRRS